VVEHLRSGSVGLVLVGLATVIAVGTHASALLAAVIAIGVGLAGLIGMEMYERREFPLRREVLAVPPVSSSASGPHSVSSFGGYLGNPTRCEPSERVTILAVRPHSRIIECIVGREDDPVSWTWEVPGSLRDGLSDIETLFPDNFPGASLHYIPGRYHYNWITDLGAGRRDRAAGGVWEMPERLGRPPDIEIPGVHETNRARAQIPRF